MSLMPENVTPTYADLPRFAELRSKELSALLDPYMRITDRYGELLCSIVAILGKMPPQSQRDTAARDLIADIFDFLYEARA